MNEFNRHASAQLAFMTACRRHRTELASALSRHSFSIDPQAPIRTLVRLARVTPGQPGLAAFETAIRASLVAYIEATPASARRALQEDAQFLVEHFDRFTEVPVTTSPIKRVVSWARRKYRGATKADRGHVD